MATVEQLLAAIKHIKDCTGNPQAWQTGLTAQDLSDVATIYVASPQRLDALVARIRSQHPDLFDPATGALLFPPAHRPSGVPADPPAGQAPSNRQEGAAADAIRSAESALAQQNSAASQLDLQVISAILNAHLTTVEGKEALDQLQHDIESAVRTRTDLDTAAGARDFQRFLVDKLKDIRAVIAGASLDDTSKSALMAALTSLYNISQGGQADPAERGTPPAVSPAAPSRSDSTEPPDSEMEPVMDSAFADDPDMSPADTSAQAPGPMPSPAMPAIPTSAPLGGAMPAAAVPGWSVPGGAPMPDLLADLGRRRSPEDVDDADLAFEDPTSDDEPSADDSDVDDTQDDAAAPPDGPAGPTTVTLPNGETVTAASPQLAAAIKAAVEGAPITDAFGQQGIAIPPPGTAVTDPIDPSRVSPGDIGMFTDRHALALGNSESLVNGQIQHISTVQGPSFLGWEHPPVPAVTTAPTKTEPPTPTRPATVAGT